MPTQEARNAPDNRPRTKKRRKRRRGRKVFARDGSVLAASGGIDAPAAVTPEPARMAPAAGSPAIQHNRIDVQIAAPRRNFGRAQPDEQPVFAALDLGTNNCRLLVAVPTRPGQFRVVDAFSRIVRLGEGLSASGRLGQPAMDRAVEALKICADKLRSRTIRRSRLIATEACRSAANGAEFLARVKARGRARRSRSSTARPRRGSPSRAAARWSSATPTASCCSTSAAARPRSR